MVKDILLAEHTAVKDFFREDLAVAEKRVNLFIKISGGGIAFIGALLGLSNTSLFGEEIGGYYQFLAVGIFISLVLLVIGYSILVGIAFLNINHMKWKKRMGILRSRFRKIGKPFLDNYFIFYADHDGYPENVPSLVMKSYTSGEKSDEPNSESDNAKRKKDAKDKELDGLQCWGNGGLNDLMLNLNAIILVVFLELSLELIRYCLNIGLSSWWTIIIFPAILIGYLTGVVVQKNRIRKKTKDWQDEVKKYITSICLWNNLLIPPKDSDT